ERVGRDHPQAPRLEVRAAAVGVDELAAGQRLGDRVDREIAGGEIGLERPALQRRDVDLPHLAGADDAPGAERVGELERRAARRPRDAPRGPARIALDREVDVVARAAAAEQPVAYRAADDPGRRVAEGLADGLDHASGTPSRW